MSARNFTWGACHDDSFFAGQPSGVLHGLLNVSQLEFRISGDYFRGSLSACEEPKNQVNRDAQAANAGFAIALLGVHGNSVKGYGCHLLSIIPDIDTEG
jgi:hypothetical protein